LEYAEGSHVVRPGEPGASELFLRISSDADGYRMPPAESKLSLSSDEIAIIASVDRAGSGVERALVAAAAGANRSCPRSRTTPGRATRSIVSCWRAWIARAEARGRSGSRAVDPRVTLDLTGLPPTLDEIDAFWRTIRRTRTSVWSIGCWRQTASARRMAVDWLDVARYADTYGYQADVYRDVWPYRDWVIRALNDNLPYDQFITWQLAGDLLPDATRDQRIATAFNRLHRQTNEGGSVEEEFRVDYVADRTDTLGAAFLGLTLGCARCHDHKYDPISQKEYYQLFAFFDNIDECGLYSHFTNAMPTPTLLLTTDQQQSEIQAAEAAIRQAEQRLEQLAAERRGLRLTTGSNSAPRNP
jgi:hypothetical protein